MRSRILAFLLLLCLLAGCAQQTATQTDPERESNQTEATDPETSAPEGSEPEVTEPDVTEPSEPESTEPSVTEPTQTEVTEPSVTVPSETETTKPTDPEVPEPTMSAGELAYEALRLEYSMLAAVVNIDALTFVKTCEDELFLFYNAGEFGLKCFIGEKKDIDYFTSQSDLKCYVDKNGIVYRYDRFDGEYEEDGLQVWADVDYYSTFDGSKWVDALEHDSRVFQEILDPESWTLGDVVKSVQTYTVYGENVSESEYEAYFQSLELAPLSSNADDMVMTYDRTNTHALISSLRDRLSKDYRTTMLSRDIDGDGDEEILVSAADLLKPYRESDTYKYWDEVSYYLNGCFDFKENYTGILVADTQGDKVTFTAYRVQGDLALTDDMTVEYRDGTLWLDDIAAE